MNCGSMFISLRLFHFLENDDDEEEQEEEEEKIPEFSLFFFLVLLLLKSLIDRVILLDFIYMSALCVRCIV